MFFRMLLIPESCNYEVVPDHHWFRLSSRLRSVTAESQWPRSEAVGLRDVCYRLPRT